MTARSFRHPARLLLDLTPLGTPSGPRGIGRYIRELALGLSELPAGALGDIELLGLTSLDWAGRFRTTRDLKSFVEEPPRSLPGEREFYSWAYKQRLMLWQAARRLDVDAVHILDPHATPLLLRLAGVKKIVTCHDVVPTLFPDHYFGVGDGGAFIGKRIERRRYRSADLVVSISDATRTDLLTHLGLPPDQVTRVYNAVDAIAWARPPSVDERETLTRFRLQGRRFLLYVGGSDYRKNVEGMMSALATARAGGVEMDLAWAGHLAPDHVTHVESIARRFGVTSSLRRLGYVTDEDLRVLYRNAVAHLFISRAEGFGLTVIEAMAAGCPVLTTRATALAEVAGDAAIAVDGEDVAAIAAAMCRLVTDSGLRAELVRRGRERAPRFSRRAQALSMATVYRRFFRLDPLATSGAHSTSPD